MNILATPGLSPAESHDLFVFVLGGIFVILIPFILYMVYKLFTTKPRG